MNNTIKAIIIDDEKHARESLQSLIELYCPSVKIIAEAADIHLGKKIIEHLQPDLVFLDISIGKETGFELLEKIQPINFYLIFTTAFSQYALNAFRVNALDYLLKPIVPSQLKSAIKKINQPNQSNQLELQLTQLAKLLHSPSLEQIAISTTDGITFLEVDKIIHIKGSANYSTFYTEDGESLVASKSLKKFESLLPDQYFYRSHQSHLVNIKFIKKISTIDGLMIKLKNGKNIPLVQKRKETLINKLMIIS